MKKIFLLFSLILILAIGSNAEALSYTFWGMDDQPSQECGSSGCGGPGAATMDINISGTTLTLTLNNTSPLDGIDNNGDPIDYNAPGITGFGFDLDPLLPFTSWTLHANGVDLVTGEPDDWQQIGGGTAPNNNDDPNAPWVITDNKIAGVSFDYLPTTDGEQIKGALYNPDAVTDGLLGALPNYFTTATLVMNFSETPILGDLNPFVRMQNVGYLGKGSLKLYGEPDDPGAPVPEPSTVLLLGIGLLGIVGLGRRKFKK